jgi:hypothetical protein
MDPATGDDAVQAVIPACEGGSCQLFGSFGIFVQILIAFWCFLVLFVLWRLETPRRPTHTWFGDMSKQMIGAFWGHMMNVYMAVCFGRYLDPPEANNQCVWYMVGFMSDIIFVTFLCWLVTLFVRPCIQRKCGLDLGDYEEPVSNMKPVSAIDGDASPAGSDQKVDWRIWRFQLLVWVGIMTFVKVVVFYFAYVFQALFYFWTAVTYHFFNLCGNEQWHRRMQLIVSIIIIPIIGDTLQFAIQDGFLKKKMHDIVSSGGARETEGKYAVISENQSLLAASRCGGSLNSHLDEASE